MERIIKQEQERLERRREILSRLEWVQECSGKLELPDDCAEIKIPQEWTSDAGILNESLFASIDEEGINLAIFDQNLPEEKCEEVVSKFTREVYKKAIGRELSQDSVSIQPIAGLKHLVCQHCFRPISNFAYKCRVCGRGFCYSHRRPESHGCSRDQKLGRPEFLKEIVRKESKSIRKNKEPRIIIRKIPCG
jgi:hypothetical protein